MPINDPPHWIKAIRHKLGESRQRFAQRFMVSARTVEGWEQGNREPSDFIAKNIEKLGRNGHKK